MLLRIKRNSYLKYRVSVWDEMLDSFETNLRQMLNSFAGES